MLSRGICVDRVSGARELVHNMLRRYTDAGLDPLQVSHSSYEGVKESQRDESESG